MGEYGPVYQIGQLTVENEDLVKQMNLADCRFGVQVAADGRVWVCVNDMAYLRFKPDVITTVVETDRHLARLADTPIPPWGEV